MNTLAPSFLIGSSVTRTTICKISDKFEFGRDSTKDCGVNCPGASGKLHSLECG